MCVGACVRVYVLSSHIFMLAGSHLLSFLTSAKPGRAIVDCLDAVGQVSFKLDARVCLVLMCAFRNVCVLDSRSGAQ